MATLQEKLQPFHDEFPLARARTIPSAWYFDPEIYALESKKVFGNSWLYVGRTEQVKDLGSYLTIEVAGEPIVPRARNHVNAPACRRELLGEGLRLRRIA